MAFGLREGKGGGFKATDSDWLQVVKHESNRGLNCNDMIEALAQETFLLRDYKESLVTQSSYGSPTKWMTKKCARIRDFLLLMIFFLFLSSRVRRVERRASRRKFVSSFCSCLIHDSTYKLKWDFYYLFGLMLKHPLKQKKKFGTDLFSANESTFVLFSWWCLKSCNGSIVGPRFSSPNFPEINSLQHPVWSSIFHHLPPPISSFPYSYICFINQTLYTSWRFPHKCVSVRADRERWIQHIRRTSGGLSLGWRKHFLPWENSASGRCKNRSLFTRFLNLCEEIKFESILLMHEKREKKLLIT